MDAKLSFNVAAWQEGKTALDIAKGRENNTDMVRRIEASTEGTDAHHTPTLRTPTLPCPYIRYYPYSSAPTLPLPYSWVVCTTPPVPLPELAYGKEIGGTGYYPCRYGIVR